MEKRGLGRGLAALIAETSGEDRASRVQDVSVLQIVPNPYQPRTLFDPLKMEELIASIKEHGVLQPVLLREVGHERYQLVAGERRFRAAQAAGLTTVPAIVKDCNDRELLEMAVVENVQREDIGAMEAARAYRRLLDEFGLTQEMVAQRVGKSRSSVANLVRLLDLPESVQDSLERGEITEGHAKALLSLRDGDAIERAWQRVVWNTLSVRDTERLTHDLRDGSGSSNLPNVSGSSSGTGPTADPRTGRLLDPNESSLVEQLRSILGTKVALRRNPNGSGRLEIEFYAAADLERIMDALLPRGAH